MFDDGDKAQIIKITHGSYLTHCIGENNDYVCKVIFTSIQNALITNGVKEAFIFDTREEFIKWLSE